MTSVLLDPSRTGRGFWELLVARSEATPDALLASKNYLTDFGRLIDEGKSQQDIYDEMTTLYPDWVSHQSWLMFNFPALQSNDR